MEIYDLSTMQKCHMDANTIVALGTFDGCHLGHVSVFRKAYEMARAQSLKTVAYTFDKIPDIKGGVKSIFTLQEKIKHISMLDIDYIAIDSFENVKQMQGCDFVNEVLCNTLRAKSAVCGYNYHFGNNASCDGEDLSEFFKNNGGRVEICPRVCVDNVPISSTLIRTMIQNGQVEEILKIAPPYSIYAKVMEGKKLGRTIGVPTVNQFIPQEKLVPKKGVYITECEIGEDVYPCVTNVGIRPTVEKNGQVNVESFIIGFNGDLYGSALRLNFYKFLREERKFDNLILLKAQIEKDIEAAKKYFG